MTEREMQVVALLRMLDDWVPCPRLSRVYRSGERGAGGSDAYVADRAVAFAAAAGDDRFAAGRRRDGELRRLELARRHEASKPWEVEAGEREPWEAAREALWREGSFAELVGLLVELEDVDVIAAVSVRVVFRGGDEYGDGTRRVFGPLLLRDAERGLRWLEPRMPGGPLSGDLRGRIRVPGPADAIVLKSLRTARGLRGKRAREEQNAEIRRRAAAGEKQRDLALAFGLSEATVSQVVRGQVEAA